MISFWFNFLFFGLLSTSFSSNVNYSDIPNRQVELVQIIPSGIIVMEEEVMLHTDTQDPNDLTVSIEVFSFAGHSVLQVSDCQRQCCITDLSVLAPGPYYVVLTTANAKIYTANIQVGH